MIALVLALAAASPTAKPAAAAAPTGAPSPAAVSRGAVALKSLGMSDAGIAIVRQQSAPDPDARALAAKRATMRGQIAAAATANPFDIDAFSALLKEASLLEGTSRARAEERMVTTLKALPAADRSIYAKAVLGIAQGPASSPPTAPKP